MGCQCCDDPIDLRIFGSSKLLPKRIDRIIERTHINQRHRQPFGQQRDVTLKPPLPLSFVPLFSHKTLSAHNSVVP